MSRLTFAAALVCAAFAVAGAIPACTATNPPSSDDAVIDSGSPDGIRQGDAKANGAAGAEGTATPDSTAERDDASSAEHCACEHPDRAVMPLSCLDGRLPDPWSDPDFWRFTCDGSRSVVLSVGDGCLTISMLPSFGSPPGSTHSFAGSTYTFDPATHQLRSMLVSWEHTWCEYAPFALCQSKRCAVLCGPGDAACKDPTLAKDVGLVGRPDDAPDDARAFESCEQAPPSTCSFTETCAQLGCGDPASVLDDEGCTRTPCSDDSDCSTEERCFHNLLSGGCQFSTLEGCSRDPAAGCLCMVTMDCAGTSHCVDDVSAPDSADCPVDGLSCDGLDDYMGSVRGAQSGAVGSVLSDLQACAEKIRARQTLSGCSSPM